ncbi:MAG TPA: FAD-dependent oxidoreductase [Jatrophihabitans sp.]|jgi:fumarate reductase flavoprotein subunit
MGADYDVVIVGAGGAGMACAITAHDAGARVLLVEAAAKTGGSTALSGGVVYGAGTDVQRAAGILYDSPRAMFGYYMTLNQWNVDPAVGWRYCEETPHTIAWLQRLGVEFPVEGLRAAGVDGVPRCHEARGEGHEVARVLHAACAERGIDIALGQRVEELLPSDGNDVVGVRSGGETVTGTSVVLTTGGFGHNRELIAEYYPDAHAAGDWCWSVSAEFSRGDGLLLGRSVGASITGRNRGLMLPTTGMEKVFETPLPGWLMFVDHEGLRFVDETASHSVITGTIKARGGSCFAIFDEHLRVHGMPSEENRRCQRSSNFTPEGIEAGVKSGMVATGGDPHELAVALGLPPDALAAAITRYNAGAASGADSQFFKAAAHLEPLATAPYYGVEVRAGIISFTSCGLRIDTQAQVLDTTGTPIPGLYAAGETTGNVLGERYLGGGNGLGNGLNFGRIAGAATAQRARAVDQRIPVVAG